MGFFDKLFGRKAGAKAAEPQSHQLPSSIVADEFGEVNICRRGNETDVDLTILMEPSGSEAEGWQTGVAIDASGSMAPVFGKGLEPGPKGSPPQRLLQQYEQKGWLFYANYMGEKFPVLTDDGKEDLVRQGYFVWSTNTVQPVIRTMTEYLANELDADGGTTVLYWACGDDGLEIEVIGDLKAEDCEHAVFEGPKKTGFGNATFLMPALKYFESTFRDAKRSMFIFITDGELNDIDVVKKETIRLCKDIEAGRRNFLKCVLIGIGDEINIDQMEQLDDLESGTNVDIWDHKIAKEMRFMSEIFAELVDENKIVAPTGRILDSSGEDIKVYSDGLPARIQFTMPGHLDSFTLEAGGKQIQQSIVTETSTL